MASELSVTSDTMTETTERILDLTSSAKAASTPWQTYIYNTIGIVGLLSNLFVIIVIATSKSMRSKITNRLIINQSLIDMCGCVFMMALSGVKFNPRISYGLWDDFKCRFWTGKILMWGLFVSSSYNLVIITVERWAEIKHPLRYKAYLTPTVQNVFFVLPWVFGLTFETIYVVPSSGILNGKCVIISIFPSFAVSVTAQFVMNSFKFYLPLSVMVGFYISIFLTLRKHSTLGLNENLGKSAAEKARDQKMAKARRNVLKTMFTVSVISFSSFVFNQQLIILLAVRVLDASMFSKSYYHASVIIVFLNLCINPFIYAIQYEQFKQAVNRLFRKVNRVVPGNVTNDGETMVTKF